MQGATLSREHIVDRIDVDARHCAFLAAVEKGRWSTKVLGGAGAIHRVIGRIYSGH